MHSKQILRMFCVNHWTFSIQESDCSLSHSYKLWISSKEGKCECALRNQGGWKRRIWTGPQHEGHICPLEQSLGQFLKDKY